MKAYPKLTVNTSHKPTERQQEMIDGYIAKDNYRLLKDYEENALYELTGKAIQCLCRDTPQNVTSRSQR